MSGSPIAPMPPISPAEMQVLVSRAGLMLNPGQMADLVLAWRQVVALLALIPRDRPLVDDQAFVFRLPPPVIAAKPVATLPRARPTTAPPPSAAAQATPREEARWEDVRCEEAPQGETHWGETRWAEAVGGAQTAPEPVLGRAFGPARRPTMTTIPSSLTIAEAGRLIAAKKLSPVELTKALLARIKAIDPKINAFLTITDKAALTAARAAERAVMAGRKDPLLGIPVRFHGHLERDLKRAPQTAHSTSCPAQHPGKHDALTVLRRLRAAGTGDAGSRSWQPMEFAIGDQPARPALAMPARNPWDTQALHPGGSSSKSAAAVASAGLATWAR